MNQYGATPSIELGARYQDLAYQIWEMLMEAADKYFVHGISHITGDERAPDFSDEVVNKQFEYFSQYRTDRGAMAWRRNDTKDLIYDFAALPLPMKRALAQRIWVKCKDSGLDQDEYWKNAVRRVKEHQDRQAPSWPLRA